MSKFHLFRLFDDKKRRPDSLSESSIFFEHFFGFSFDLLQWLRSLFLENRFSSGMIHHTGFGCCVGKSPNLFFTVILCREYLSSGENLAGCADNVLFPSGVVF